MGLFREYARPLLHRERLYCLVEGSRLWLAFAFFLRWPTPRLVGVHTHTHLCA